MLKGSCDHLSWRSALGYRAVLPDTTLVHLPGAGHNVHEDRPTEVLAAMRAFLTGAPLPLPAYPGTAVPAEFEGPP